MYEDKYKLSLHNSLTRKKEEFIPLDESHVRIYACGPTVYDYAHIGNARMAVIFDVLVRILREIYPKVTYVSNLTDIDDKIIAASEKSGKDIEEITEKFARIYNEDMAALGVRKPDIQSKATQTIPEMIELIKILIERDYAYVNDGHVLFNVTNFDNYGKLSGRSRDEQIAGARVEIAPYKKDPADFVLWKPSDDDQPGWNSPWGRGRPGWHIECSAMAEKYLGLPFDIHGGGADLKFPHHENEIAQSCCAHGKEDDLSAFARYWVHNGFLTVNGEKMSKSLGNFTTAHQALEEYKGEVIRLTLLSAHYRQPLDWSDDILIQNKKVLDRFYQVLYSMSDIEIDENIKADEVLEALCDDINTPKAMAVLNSIERKNDVEYKSKLLAAGKILGILQENPAKWLGYGQVDDVDVNLIEKLIEQRTIAKKSKDYVSADDIRNQLSAMGISIEDTPDGVKWKKL